MEDEIKDVQVEQLHQALGMLRSEYLRQESAIIREIREIESEG